MGNKGSKVDPKTRIDCLAAIDEAIRSGASKKKACETLGVSIRTIQRWKQLEQDQRKGPIKKPYNALSNEEKNEIIRIVNSEEFANDNPWEIVAKLADRGIYLASESTIYRILRSEKLLSHRRRSRLSTSKKPDCLIATGPNQVWSWDITYLKNSSKKGDYFFLYLVMDLYSRKIVYWAVHDKQTDVLAAEMIQCAYLKEGLQPGQVRLHSDNGSPMKGATMLATLQWLGIKPSFSRPGVSDDNPYSEALFKTLKYCPQFPWNGFSSIGHAKAWTEEFVSFYNNHHLHSGIKWVTPEQRHTGADKEILANRIKIYKQAKKTKPQRWSKDIRNWKTVDEVILNPHKLST